MAVIGDTIDVPGATIQVTALDRRRIAGVRVTPLSAANEDTSAAAAEWRPLGRF
jgi:putative hemolysin